MFENKPVVDDECRVELAQLHPARRNPNVLSEEKLVLLRQVVARIGFTQPICVRPMGIDQHGLHGFEIIDGHHRVKVAGELGLTELPAVAVHCSEAEAEVLRAAMNRLRGEVDLTVMTAIVRDLHDGGWQVEDMTLTGFTGDELADLLSASAAADTASVMDQPVDTSFEDRAEPEAKFTLEVEFRSRADMAKVKRQLRKIGKGDLASGLLSLLGEAK